MLSPTIQQLTGNMKQGHATFMQVDAYYQMFCGLNHKLND